MDRISSILAIEDNQDDLDLYERSLKEACGEGFRFLAAGSGEAGLKAIAEHFPDCVLLDYSLPGPNGVEVLRRIRARYDYLPVVMLTGQGNEAIAVQSLKEGAHDYISKAAITPDGLRRIVHAVMERGALQKRIHEQRASLEIFTRALAHDLKEPMRTIRSFLDRITDWNRLSEKSRQSFRYISKAADRMNALIDAVHLYTRLDGAEQMEKESCDLNGVLQGVQENLAQLIRERGAIITHDALPAVYANRVQMTQLFQNLLANAIRHCDTPVTAHVGAEKHAGRWRLHVRDNGPGIAGEYLESMFDPFRRMSHRRQDEPGLGLGLAINRKIVEHHEGKIWCESQPGAGAVFYFTLPAAEARAGEEDTARGPVLPLKNAAAASPLARILLVDDSEPDIELNRVALIEESRMRCEVVTACSGGNALTLLQEAARNGNPIDLVLLDINMPGMNGFELLAQVQKEKMNSMIVMCTTSNYDIDRRSANSLGAAGYLTKPLQFSLFKEIINRSRNLRLGREGDGYALLRTC